MNSTPAISSSQNEFVKMARSLQDKKGREEQGAFLVEGEKCVHELLTHSPQTLRALIVTPEYQQDSLALTESLGKRIVIVEPRIMKAICDCVTPQNVAAVADVSEPAEIMSGFIVAMDDVADPANVGTIIRTADAAGCAGVVLSNACADSHSPKAVRASMGSLFHLPVIRTNLSSCLEELRLRDYEIACADLKGTEDFCLNAENTCVVIGNESRGISEEILKLATTRIRIPIYGKAESLNAAVAAGILIYKIRT